MGCMRLNSVTFLRMVEVDTHDEMKAGVTPAQVLLCSRVEWDIHRLPLPGSSPGPHDSFPAEQMFSPG